MFCFAIFDQKNQFVFDEPHEDALSFLFAPNIIFDHHDISCAIRQGGVLDLIAQDIS